MSEIMTGESTLMQFIIDVAKLLGVSDAPYVEAGDGTLFYPNIKPSSEEHNYSEVWAVGDGDTIGVIYPRKQDKSMNWVIDEGVKNKYKDLSDKYKVEESK